MNEMMSQKVGSFEYCGNILTLSIKETVLGKIEFDSTDTESSLLFMTDSGDEKFQLSENVEAYIKKVYFSNISRDIPDAYDEKMKVMKSMSLFRTFLKESHQIIGESNFIPDIPSRILLCKCFTELLEENNLHLKQYRDTYVNLLELHFDLAREYYHIQQQEGGGEGKAEATDSLYYALKHWLDACRDFRYTVFEDERIDREEKIHRAIFRNDGKIIDYFYERKDEGKDEGKNNRRFEDLLRNVGYEWFLRSRYDLKSACKILMLRGISKRKKRGKDRAAKSVSEKALDRRCKPNVHSGEMFYMLPLAGLEIIRNIRCYKHNVPNRTFQTRSKVKDVINSAISSASGIFRRKGEEDRALSGNQHQGNGESRRKRTCFWWPPILVLPILLLLFILAWKVESVPWLACLVWIEVILAYSAVVIVIPALYFWLRQIEFIKLLIPRMVGTIALGYSALIITEESWVFSLSYYDYANSGVKLWEYLAIIVAALLISFLYLLNEIAGGVKDRGLALKRASSLFCYGAVQSFAVGLVLFDFFADGMTYAPIEEMRIWHEVTKMRSPVGHIYPLPLILYASLALVIGILLQMLWEDKPITEKI
jgi:hypothetical protein